jgi:riboflavin-specific deaminase-like protein
MTRDAAAVKPIAARRAGSVDGARSEPQPAGDCDTLWALCLEIARLRRQGLPPAELAGGSGLGWSARKGWVLDGQWSAAAQEMFDLYRPLLGLQPGERYVLGHLGQSIDGRIATSAGDSCYINGQQNLVHMHRLRALCDAVLVGAGTIVSDDPQLTTRLVPGPHATRVVIDPSQRLTPAFRVCSDGRCPTLVARVAAQPTAAQPAPAQSGAPQQCGSAEVIAATAAPSGIDLPALLDDLAARGLRVILVEGGGITVSRFLEQKLLDRLQIAIAPVIIGSGRQGLQLPEVLALDDCLRPSCRQRQMGPDILWDLDLRAATPRP